MRIRSTDLFLHFCLDPDPKQIIPDPGKCSESNRIRIHNTELSETFFAVSDSGFTFMWLVCLFFCVVVLHGSSCDLLENILVVVLSSSCVPHPCLYEDGNNLFTMSLVGFLKTVACSHTFYLVWNAVPAFCNSN